jgi:hypothetical protein
MTAIGNLYLEPVGAYKINMLGTHYEDCHVLVLGENPIPGFKRNNSFQVLITFPNGRLLYKEYFAFTSFCIEDIAGDRRIA